MDRMDPTNFDRIAHERRTTIRSMELGPDPDATQTSPGYRFVIAVGRNTSQSITLNAGEIRRLAYLAARAALQYAPEGEMCPECGVIVAREDGALVDHERDGNPCPGSGFDAEGPQCPACRGAVHVDLAGAIWPTDRRTEAE